MILVIRKKTDKYNANQPDFIKYHVLHAFILFLHANCIKHLLIALSNHGRKLKQTLLLHITISIKKWLETRCGRKINLFEVICCYGRLYSLFIILKRVHLTQVVTSSKSL